MGVWSVDKDEACTTVHLSVDHLQPVDLALHLAGASRPGSVSDRQPTRARFAVYEISVARAGRWRLYFAWRQEPGIQPIGERRIFSGLRGLRRIGEPVRAPLLSDPCF